MTRGASPMGSETPGDRDVDSHLCFPHTHTDIAMTQALQSLKDTQRQTLLLQALAGAVRRQHRRLQDPMQRLQNQLKRLQDMQRWGSAFLGS